MKEEFKDVLYIQHFRGIVLEMRDYRQQAQVYLTSILKRRQRIRMQGIRPLLCQFYLKSNNIVDCHFALARQQEHSHKTLFGLYLFITTVEWSPISLFNLKGHYSCAKKL